MNPFPLSRSALRRGPLWLATGLLTLACALAVFGLVTSYADAPALTITIKTTTPPDCSTCVYFVVHATGFPASTAFTETINDGKIIAPVTGTTHSDGSAFDWTWELDISTKYCGSATVQAGSAQATTNFWVAPANDTDSGKTCTAGATGGGTTTPAATTPAGTTTPAATTPTVDATAAAATAAAAPTQPPAQPTDNTSPGTGTGIRARLASLPWGIIGGGLAVLVIIIGIAMMMGRRGGDDEQQRWAQPPRGATGQRPMPRQGSGRGPSRGGGSNWRG
ncbi:MAG TPA: hypothetical protein VF916_11295 [Ktedonobacterales bacterium]